MLCAGYVTGIAAMQVAIRVRFSAELKRISRSKHFLKDGLIFRFGAVAKDHPIWFGQPGRLIHPGFHWSCHALPPEKQIECSKNLNRNSCPAGPDLLAWSVQEGKLVR